MKIAVIGSGGSGSAALRFLARDGHEAVGFERLTPGHAMGSSHGHSRIIRRSYPDRFHTRMMARAYRLWDELEEESGEELFVRCGGITFGPAGDPTLESTRRALVDEGLEFNTLSREETAARFPAIDIGGGSTALFQAESGFLRATRCVLAQVRLAEASGARIHRNTPVLGIEEQDRHVLVSTAGATEAFDAVIVTAGPWLGKLLAPLGLPLRTALRQVVYLGIAGDAEDFAPERLPVWIEHPSDHYGFPGDGEVAGIKVASHDGGVDFDPDQPDRPRMDRPLGEVVEHAMKRFPGLSGEVVATQSCLYTITPDERFIIDHAPGSRRVVVCSGCSGHGVKVTVLLGQLCTAMARGEDRDPDADPWRLDRF
jgi:sarcosine oxidase